MGPEEDWMCWGLCRAYPELGWINDADQTGPAETVVMQLVCSLCTVAEECAAFAARAGICGGFWAGAFRDPTAVELVAGTPAGGGVG